MYTDMILLNVFLEWFNFLYKNWWKSVLKQKLCQVGKIIKQFNQGVFISKNFIIFQVNLFNDLNPI